MWLLAQPDPALLQGDVQEILAWVVLSQIALWLATVTYFLRRQTMMEKKYDGLQVKLFKALSRSNRAMEAVAKLPPPEDHSDV